MLDKGQKFGVYSIKDIIGGHWEFSRYLSEDPFFKSDVFLNIQSIESFSLDQKNALGQRLDHLFLLEHPAIVPVYDTGYESGAFYFTTNFYEAESFHNVVSRGMTFEQVVDIAISLARALEHASANGFFHDSLLPQDLVFDENGQVGILNFGVSYSFDWVRAAGKTESETIASNLNDLGLLLKSMLGVADVKGAEEGAAQLETAIERCLPFGDQAYQLFRELIDDLSKISFDRQSVSEKEETQILAMQTCQDDLISEQQRAQLLPHLRELVGAKNRVQEELDEIKEKHLETQKELKDAQDKVEALTLRVNKLMKYDNRLGRKKALLWLLCGMLAGALLFFIFPERGEDKTAKEPLVSDLRQLEVKQEPATVQHHQQPNQTGGESGLREATEEEPEGKVVAAEGEELLGDNIEKIDNSEPLTQSSADEIKEFVAGWSDSWSRQDVDAYLGHYSINYQPSNGLTVSDWMARRVERIGRPDWIAVGIDEVEVELLEQGVAQVSFLQNYRSDRYEDWSRKSLGLTFEAGAWKIVQERSRSL